MKSYLECVFNKKVTCLIVYVHAFESCIFKGIHLEDTETNELLCVIE